MILPRRLLIIDGNNAFYRSYTAVPAVSVNGTHVGGIVGFLKILQKACKNIKPTKVVVVWDGAGGSRKRKQINKEYKKGRKTPRLNRSHDFLNSEEEGQNKLWQHARLISYINQLPIRQLISDGVEADDIISWVCQNHYCDTWQKVILSNDKDFIQILDECTVLFRPVKDEFLTIPRVIQQYGIHPNNFALARAIAGDRSDNLRGIKGMGLKTIAKNFTFLEEETSHLLSDIIDICKRDGGKKVTMKRIVEGEDLIRENYKTMQLYSPLLSYQTIQRLKGDLSQKINTINKTNIRAHFIKDGITNMSLENLFESCIKLQKEGTA